MKKTVFTFLFAICASFFAQSQQIEKEKVFGGYKYSINGKAVSMKEMVNLMESDAKAMALMKKAKSNTTLATILGGAGGALIGFPVGAAIGGGEANWTIAGVGAGLIIVAIPIASGANKKANEAVDLYNASLDATSYNNFKPQFNMLINGNGVGISMSF
ncbi:hypothetical protein P8625_11740 [Tenacibaculum tangerinum]|uniref:Glycine zipper family protein n=1 Tax=Tenacibaculum tangerinum TaxID=3038772 RepID=A0ABY8L4C2_9FLAO|nr:hypothetical protein [Tenacibaculum tangerinum]WGH74750.1 hypothetical protein P8625_11740 [Tenacibaculum tangerinum]